MTRNIIGAAAFSILGLILASPAGAQDTMCAARGQIVDKLAKDFKEAPMAVGMVDKSAVLEIFVSNTGTWTILATRTDGTSCIVSAGEGWDSKTMVIGADA